ncbi:RagB/SusD family nutrient uptake outer membrane protein [Pedobacter sp. JY14-1]|uniref:RagB/SusD family nutrient uptake outer membrane protein n=1 Tax=Pedobacter sp. JY14-1 TaxID=3034151 RepID=UPI0023E24C00|nr:RagB/SusD family nutrient uptake outer membrane protein [Pedobacter sp. JY14-1]
MRPTSRLYIIRLAVPIIAILSSSCKKIIEVDPPVNSVIGREIYENNTTATSVLIGIYTDMSLMDGFTGQNSISVRTGLSGDELVSVAEPNSILSLLYTNQLTNNGNLLFWPIYYSYIFRVNSAIEGITNSNNISATVKRQLIAEAKFLRAFLYFYLANLYGDIPLATTTDIKNNIVLPRSNKALVFEQILNDLKDSKSEISSFYVGGNSITASDQRIRPNKATVTALLARVYLFLGNWKEAEAEADSIISNSSNYTLESLDEAFLSNSREAIWQLQPVVAALNTMDGNLFVLLPGSNLPAGPDGFGRPVYLNKDLYNSFEESDLRKTHWIDSVSVSGTTYPFPYKYKAWEYQQPRTEYLMVFRLSEQILIRAEARMHLGRLSGVNSAESDLNLIRKRAGLNDISLSTANAMELIVSERRHELFTEWGHRWLDLKRLNKIDEVMNKVASTKGTTWANYKSLYPLPIEDIKSNPSLVGHQNPGYPEN